MNSFDMYIVCACDDGYSVHCGALITSIFENHTHCRIEVFVLTDSISDDNRAKFGLLADRYHQRIDIIAIDKSLFRNLPFGGKFDNISIATYYRLLVASVLPDNLDKVLYLDCDIIVKADLMPLWNIDLNRFAFAAVEDALPHSVEAPKRLDYSALERYYNCGVLLMNLTILREMDFIKCAHSYWNNHLEKIVMHDQDIINALFHGCIKPLSAKWNMMEPFLFKKPWIPHDRLQNIKEGLREPCIIHFTGSMKPWFKESIHPYKNMYWIYRKMSPWKNSPEQRKYQGFRLFKYRVKQLIKQNILPVVGIRKYSFR